VASRNAEERAQLGREHDVLREKLRRAIELEKAVARREKAAMLKEVEVDAKEQATRGIIDGAKEAAKMIDVERATLRRREVAVQEREDHLTTLQIDLEARIQDLKEREAAVQEKEAKVEGLLAERSAWIERVVKWVGEANTSLDTLGLSPIPVAEAPSSLSVILPVLDSAAE
jgi:hypothetical protein